MNLKSTVWAHTLFKNSEKWLWFSVTSVIDHVDKILLWDTGSTDKSWEIAKLLKEKYGDKIDLRQYGAVTSETFPAARQAMLDVTEADWFIVVDDDEIWWKESITQVVTCIKSITSNTRTPTESIVVPTVNVIGDIFHKQPDNAGRYKFGDKLGHFNLRAVKRSIEGLHSEGQHGVWGWADKDGKQIQDRNTFKFVDAPYLHTTFLSRTSYEASVVNVPKRKKKIKHELGLSFSLDFYYPEVFFKERPEIVPSPWAVMSTVYRLQSMIVTPFKKLRRLFKNEKVGY